MRELVHKHVGEAAVIIGGAPSRLMDIKQCPKEAVFISANDHGCRQQTCHYICACEDLGERLFSWKIPVISGHPMSDYRVFDIPLPNSAALGAWAAWIMGCTPIVVTGVECYQGKTYVGDPHARTSGHSLVLEEHLHRWERLNYLCPGIQIRVISGPLARVFPMYWAGELKKAPSNKEEATKRSTGIRMKFHLSIDIGERHYPQGEIHEVTALEERFLARNHEGLATRL